MHSKPSVANRYFILMPAAMENVFSRSRRTETTVCDATEASKRFVAKIEQAVGKAEVADDLEATFGKRTALNCCKEVIMRRWHQRYDGNFDPRAWKKGRALFNIINPHENAGQLHNSVAVLTHE